MKKQEKTAVVKLSKTSQNASNIANPVQNPKMQKVTEEIKLDKQKKAAEAAKLRAAQMQFHRVDTSRDCIIYEKHGDKLDTAAATAAMIFK